MQQMNHWKIEQSNGFMITIVKTLVMTQLNIQRSSILRPMLCGQMVKKDVLVQLT